ncbi:MAG: winged helix-turn-helix domain-containing protein [Halobacteria archaeon]
MEKTLWYLLTGMRGGENRVRIIDSLTDTPKNANQLSEDLDLGYKTVRHHLSMLEDHDVVETEGEGYGKMYFLTDRFMEHEKQFNKIRERME